MKNGTHKWYFFETDLFKVKTCYSVDLVSYLLVVYVFGLLIERIAINIREMRSTNNFSGKLFKMDVIWLILLFIYFVVSNIWLLTTEVWKLCQRD